MNAKEASFRQPSGKDLADLGKSDIDSGTKQTLYEWGRTEDWLTQLLVMEQYHLGRS
jgi:hypothetical protein